MDSEEHILLDENTESQGEDYFYLGAFQVSPDHSLLCYSVDTEGNEKFSLRLDFIVDLLDLGSRI
jgi:oligopeptidase B